MSNSIYNPIPVRLQKSSRNRPSLTADVFEAVRGMSNRQAYRYLRGCLHRAGYSKTAIKRFLGSAMARRDGIDSKYAIDRAMQPMDPATDTQAEFLASVPERKTYVKAKAMLHTLRA